MRFQSTQKISPEVSYPEALLQGLAPDGGLYVPVDLAGLKRPVADFNRDLPFLQHAIDLLTSVLGPEVEGTAVEEICEQAFDFEIPLKQLDEDTWILELFHGPTAAFKDFGARFMAGCLAAVDANSPGNHQTWRTILVATSGDTGSAVAQAFGAVPGVRVVLLYPAGHVSPLQEVQLTSVPQNVTSVRVAGTFDDCQRLAKEAFANVSLQHEYRLTSANSINIARLLPQATYYAHAALEMRTPPILVVPSGNLGNLTAGLYAKRLGAPIDSFVAAVNRNQPFVDYLNTGEIHSRPTLHTPSNAMDVGNPSNLDRIVNLYEGTTAQLRKDVVATSIDDDATLNTMRQVAERFSTLVCPHTSVGIAAWHKLRKTRGAGRPAIVLATAHPGKFPDLVRDATAQDIQLPQAIRDLDSSTRAPQDAEAHIADLTRILQG